jgi:hypothetical protein
MILFSSTAKELFSILGQKGREEKRREEKKREEKRVHVTVLIVCDDDPCLFCMTHIPVLGLCYCKIIFKQG